MNDRKQGPEIEGLTFLQHLGAGGFSDVYLYQRHRPRMQVAVKVLTDDRPSDAEIAQFADEAETMAELADHPNIVQVFSTGVTDEGHPYLVMKYYPPPNLAQRAATERFTVAEVLRTGIQIAGAVETAHRARILHRDIKPSNILQTKTGAPGLADFGIAGRGDTSEDDEVAVSIPWSPPEVLGGHSNGSVASDVFSLAATLWHLLAGRSPYEVPGGDNSRSALTARILTSAPKVTGRADVPRSLERLLQQAMAKHPQHRPETAASFGRSLQAVEQELRYSRTELVILGDDIERPDPGPLRDDVLEPPAPLAPPTTFTPLPDLSSGGFAATSVSAPSTPSAPPAPPVPPAAPPVPQRTARRTEPAADHPRTAVRPSRPSSPAQTPATEVRPRVQSPEPPAPGPEPRIEQVVGRRGLRRPVAIALSAVVVLVVAVSGVLLTRGDGADDPSTNPTPKAPDGSNVNGFDAGNGPRLEAAFDTATRKATFTWSAPDGTPDGFRFGYTIRGGKAVAKTDATSVTFSAVSAETACIQVALLLPDGTKRFTEDCAG